MGDLPSTEVAFESCPEDLLVHRLEWQVSAHFRPTAVGLKLRDVIVRQGPQPKPWGDGRVPRPEHEPTIHWLTLHVCVAPRRAGKAIWPRHVGMWDASVTLGDARDELRAPAVEQDRPGLD